MGKSVVLGVVTMVISFSMCEGYIACYDDDFDVNREGILGKNVTFRCYTSLVCDEVRWDLLLVNKTAVSPSGEQVQVGYNTSYLSIFGIGFHHEGLFRCWCYASSSVKSICSFTLKTICQATVRLNGRTIVYNSSLSNSHSLDVTAGETISIACSKGATMVKRNCSSDLLPASDEPTYQFEVLQEHNLCVIKCRLRSGDGDSCNVRFTVNVIRRETPPEPSTTPRRVSTVPFHPSVDGTVLTTTSKSNIFTVPTTVVSALNKPSSNLSTSIPNGRSISAHTTMPDVKQTKKDNAVPNKSGSFPVMLSIGIPIAVLVGILFIICFFVYFSRSKSTSRRKKKQNLGNESPDTNIPIGPTYATINKSSPGGDEDSAERGIPCTDDAYDEVGRDVKREPTQQDNAVKAETSVTKDYYSVVNTSNTKLESTDSGSKSESALYTEVNKEVKQAGKNVGALSPESSGCNPNVPDVSSDPPYDVSEQPESSEYDAVGVVSTSSALYAVVEKERKKE
ncbi:hypothetical protein HOLleu_24969 [Holothuria leucospilota]|uniref:Uncharacterized protein n=1 Tax=Holothuria leucospilota TaxID=206669 RepID=A0A9Q1BRU8_HOLLE|nr:hypothetical protein HOLleu_24969 [Holothuria leucospilota]